MTSPALGRSLELHYINGQPDGMLTAEMFNWTGHVLLVPRAQLSQALARTEACYAGIYLLLGEKEGETLAYVGESEDIGSRIKSHDAAKDWWSMAVLVTTAGNKLNKAHVRYLEARLIEQAKSVGRTPLDNGTNPPRPTLSEADVSKMEAFLENIFIVLPAVRVDLFIQRTRPTPTVAPTAKAPSAEFILETKKHGVKARAVLVEGEFVVEAGSTARLAWEGVGSEMTSYGQLHQELRNEGVLQPQGTVCVFANNYAFKSPSAAAAVVNGRPANGTVEWKTPDGQTYKDWEAQQLSTVPAS
ncbi:GIY-YIG nuclease family protein [Bradyrhizobium tropiciagri]|uniref:GIY-YIG nuclease family protein n=1 Tax=Bradyrhizobium tropiciagri TaxID=312253 RepID=UPI001BA7A9CF|nr:GIY-YIG nuclease family protein [Bradyrhizobium tropiciagri]MBR0869639.1 GIY-YIG nuclease family protein [Bradyrhizobium tropiciagri]